MTSLMRFNQPTLKTFDSFLENLFNDFSSSGSENFKFPAVDICETADEYHVDFFVPGKKKEDFKINLEKNVLSVSLEHSEEKKEENKQYIRREFFSNSFKRSFTLDDKIDQEKIDAKYEDGVLKITLPKKEEVKVMPKEISIQ